MSLLRGRLTGATRTYFANSPRPIRCHFVTTRIEGEHGVTFKPGLAHRIVPERSVDALAERGYILRCSSAVPIYRISRKGKEYLRMRSEAKAIEI